MELKDLSLLFLWEFIKFSFMKIFTLTQAFGNLRVVHFGIVLRNFSSLQATPNLIQVTKGQFSNSLISFIEFHTMKAFIGRLMWSSCGFFINDVDVSRLKIVELLEKNCFKNEVPTRVISKWNSPIRSNIVEQSIELLVMV